MSFKPLIYDDCCLLANIDLNSERIYHLLERRYKSNSTKISFDFKSFLPEQPSNNAKVSRSLLRCQPKLTYINDYEDNNSSNSSLSSSSEDENDDVFLTDDDDDRLNKLAEWEPSNFQPMIETDDEDEDEDENENIFESVTTENNDKDHSINPMDISSVEETLNSSVEDLLVTFIHRPSVKAEPIVDNYTFDNPPQLDGQIDVMSSTSNKNDINKRLDDTIARVLANTPTPNKTIRLHDIAIPKTKFRLVDDIKKKSTNPTPRRFSSKIDSSKERIRKEIKPPKKAKTRLLSSLLKTNEDTIRPLQTPFVTYNQKPTRLSSDNQLQTANSKVKIQRKSFSNDEQRKSSSSMGDKQKNLSKNSKILVKSKEKSASHHMTIEEKKFNHFQKSQQSQPKDNIKIPSNLPKTKISDIQKSTLNVQKKAKNLKRLDINQTQTKPKKQNSTNDSSITKQQTLTNQSSVQSANSDNKTNKRPADFFKGCITIDDDDDIHTEEHDDDDIQEIERQPYSIAYNIRSREKLLDHIVHSSTMHIQWLFNLDYVLLEHIAIYNENNVRLLNDKSSIIKNEFASNISTYQIDPSFISIIIINFLKLFILQNSSINEQNISFIQFGLTSHLRYLLIELPTYNHNDDKDNLDYCLKCHQYSLIINILFDLLFDLIEYELCEIKFKTKYRSSLIEDDYFKSFLQIKVFHNKNTFYRIKFIIYFIELIGIHMYKCSNKKQFQFNQNENKLFHTIEDFIRHILLHINKNSINQRISICFNIMELCILFVDEKQIRIKQMALFLAQLCEEKFDYINLFLFDKNLFTDIRLLLINELISKKFHRKFISIEHIQQVFEQIQENFNSIESIDEFDLLILRSLFNTYGDFIVEIKQFPLMYSNTVQELQLILHKQLELIFNKFTEISYKNPEYLEKIKSIWFSYRLLKCKWNKL